MTNRLLMLDSGAFSVWAQGAFSKKKEKDRAHHNHKIDLDAYIDFCRGFTDISYYVNLDVIPGKPRDKRSLTREAIEQACREGYSNWRRMTEGGIPFNKVIPVFHQNDGFGWLERYLSDNCKYIGISPANDATVGEKLKWMQRVRKFIFDDAGRPLVKTHGFAVTTYKLMKYWDWYSVDSASWKLWASWGIIYVPVKRGGEFAYDEPPHIVAVSPASKKVSAHQEHILSASPTFKESIKEYLNDIGAWLGKYEIIPVKPDYNLKKGEIAGEGESWYRKHRKIIRPSRHGVMTSFRERARANIRFMKRAEKALSTVEHIYFAGAPMPLSYEPCLETSIRKRLLSFHEIGQSKENSCLQHHLDLMGRTK